MGAVWFVLVVFGIVLMAIHGTPAAVTQALLKGTREGLSASIDLLAVTSLWLGISKVAERAGLLEQISLRVSPWLRWLFPSLRPGHPALGSMTLNLVANILGLGNAATPFGLRAMEQMAADNPNPGRITPAMSTFLVLNSACVTLIPATAIALRAATGSAQPGAIAIPAAIASSAATAAVLVVDGWWRHHSQRQERRRHRRS